MIGRGEDDAALAVLDAGPQPAQHRQLCQFAETNTPTPAEDEVEIVDLWHRTWKDEDGVWITDFPPPPGFTGYQSCEWNDPDRSYQRECAAEEVQVLEANDAAAEAEDRSKDEQLRDEWFDLLRAELPCTESSDAGVDVGEDYALEDEAETEEPDAAEPAAHQADADEPDADESGESGEPGERGQPETPPAGEFKASSLGIGISVGDTAAAQYCGRETPEKPVAGRRPE